MSQRILFINEDMAYWRARLDPTAHPAMAWDWIWVATAIVASYTLPDYCGIGFLDDTARDFPKALRFVRADTTRHPVMIRCLGSAHQTLPRNTSSSEARDTLQRALNTPTWLPGERTRTLLAGGGQRSSPPAPEVEYLGTLGLDGHLQEWRQGGSALLRNADHATS